MTFEDSQRERLERYYYKLRHLLADSKDDGIKVALSDIVHYLKYRVEDGSELRRELIEVIESIQVKHKTHE